MVTWIWIIGLVALTFGTWLSKPPTAPQDLPTNPLFWIGAVLCIAAIIIHISQGGTISLL